MVQSHLMSARSPQFNRIFSNTLRSGSSFFCRYSFSNSSSRFLHLRSHSDSGSSQQIVFLTFRSRSIDAPPKFIARELFPSPSPRIHRPRIFCVVPHPAFSSFSMSYRPRFNTPEIFPIPHTYPKFWPFMPFRLVTHL